VFAPARYYISKESALTIYIFRHYYTNDAGCDKSAGSDEDHEDKSIPSLHKNKVLSYKELRIPQCVAKRRNVSRRSGRHNAIWKVHRDR
jgi:hypothetical protein